MIIKAIDISGKSDGWLKKITAETVDLTKYNGYCLTSPFYNYDEVLVIKPGEFFVIDTGRRGTRTLYNSRKKPVKKETRKKTQKKAGFSEKIIAKIENSLLYDFGAYVVAVAKLKEPAKQINPLEKFTVEQLIKELQSRGHNVKLDDAVFVAQTKKENTRWNALEDDGLIEQKVKENR